MKECTKCGKIKDLSDFYDHPKVDGKKECQCKECKKADNKKWQQSRPKSYRKFVNKLQISRNGSLGYKAALDNMPKKISQRLKNKIRDIYKHRPDGMEVDHIIPLNHPLICGLHLPDNLQYLTKEDNLKKRNNVDWSKCIKMK